MTRRTWLFLALAAVCVVALALAPMFLSSFWVSVLTQALIFALAAAALDVMVGYAGMVSLGQAAFVGVAGYTVGLTITELAWNPWMAALLGVLVAIAVGAAFGLLAVQTRGIYFLVITLAFAQVLWGLAVRWTDVTGGYNGIPGVPRPQLPLVELGQTTPFYYATAVVVVVCLVILWMVVRSPLGLTFEGVRTNEPRLRILGYRTMAYRWLAFCIAAGFGGIAGVMNVFYMRFVGPDSLYWTMSAQLLLIVIIGGVGTLWGAAAAGVLLGLARVYITNVSDRWITVLGVLYIVTVLVAPEGWFRYVRDQAVRGWGFVRSRRRVTT
jgi:branched-chain amino acid transport system permease protein